MPLVSIVTPAFNAAATLLETANSVLAQSLADWEWCIVDDASNDGTKQLLEKLASQDPRIKVVYLSQNMGNAQARAKAFDMASGRYIAYLDADDTWPANKLQRQLDFMKEKGAVLSYTSYRRKREGEAGKGTLIHVPRQLTYHAMLANTAIACSSAMYDREGIGPLVPPELNEMATWLEILRRGHVAHGLDEDLMSYRVWPGSASSNKRKAIRRVWHIYRDVEKLSLPYSIYCLARYGARAIAKRAGMGWLR